MFKPSQAERGSTLNRRDGELGHMYDAYIYLLFREEWESI